MNALVSDWRCSRCGTSSPSRHYPPCIFISPAVALLPDSLPIVLRWGLAGVRCAFRLRVEIE